jgi:hypothetical protein
MASIHGNDVIQQISSAAFNPFHSRPEFWRMTTTEKYFPPAALVYGVPKRREAEQISASISVRWEPDRIFAYHNSFSQTARVANCGAVALWLGRSSS